MTLLLKIKKPVVLSYSGFLIIWLFDLLWEKQGLDFDDNFVDPIEKEKQRVVAILSKGNLGIREPQKESVFKSRAYFIERVINPLIDNMTIERIGNNKSRNSFFRLRKSNDR